MPRIFLKKLEAFFPIKISNCTEIKHIYQRPRIENEFRILFVSQKIEIFLWQIRFAKARLRCAGIVEWKMFSRK